MSYTDSDREQRLERVIQVFYCDFILIIARYFVIRFQSDHIIHRGSSTCISKMFN